MTELQSGWARTVITGLARLGGLPVGVVAVETSTVNVDVPADPGDASSSAKTVPQAGQIWFPDSAAKTAQAMEEFARQGLPLFILANWRGFSGGMRDLFEGVLQQGSLIVENLRTYPHPVFVYLPRGAELRGGAWVVVDRRINPDQVEMYADPSARGNVLEAEGAAGASPPRRRVCSRRTNRLRCTSWTCTMCRSGGSPLQGDGLCGPDSVADRLPGPARGVAGPAPGRRHDALWLHGGLRGLPAPESDRH